MRAPRARFFAFLFVAHPHPPQGSDSIAEFVADHARPVIESLVDAAAEHAVIILGDVHPAAAPKLALTELVPALRARGFLDLVALEVPMTQQPAIRAYLASDPEDVQILLDHPLLLRAHWGASQEYLAIYRTVWALNHDPRPDSPIEILAIDSPRGPPAVGSTREALERFVNRDALMELRLRRWREGAPDKRVLVFVGDLHTLKDVEVDVDLGRDFARLVPLAERLDRLWPGEVYTVFSDAAVPDHPEGASRLFPLVRDALSAEDDVIALPPQGPLARVPSPIDFDTGGGEVKLALIPRSYTIDRVTDLYLYFGTSPPLTLLPVPGRE